MCVCAWGADVSGILSAPNRSDYTLDSKLYKPKIEICW